jgi:hypothetical protein
MVASFKAFKEYHIYMGLKKKPNSKHYWMSNSMFHDFKHFHTSSISKLEHMFACHKSNNILKYIEN